MSVDLINHVMTALESNERDEDDSPDVALCDCCDEQPGSRMIQFGGMDTWICDDCSDYTYSSRRPSLANAWQNRDADEAGVRMYGEI